MSLQARSSQREQHQEQCYAHHYLGGPAALFVLLLAFAAKNTEPVALRFYFDLVWQAPLIALLLAFFAAGALFGLAAALATLLRQRRELQRLKREAGRSAGESAEAAPVPPAPAEG